VLEPQHQSVRFALVLWSGASVGSVPLLSQMCMGQGGGQCGLGQINKGQGRVEPRELGGKIKEGIMEIGAKKSGAAGESPQEEQTTSAYVVR